MVVVLGRKTKNMSMSPETSYSLIAKLRDPNDVAAWSEFASIYQPLIFRIVSDRGLQYADATDVTQEVLSRVSKAVGAFDANHHKVTFRGWLYRITRNLTIDYLRKQKRGQRVADAGHVNWEMIAEPSTDDSDHFRKQFEKQLFIVVAEKVRQRVTEKTWRAFWETEINQRAVSDVARELAMTPGSVYVCRSRVIARLKEQVQRRMEETVGETS